MSNQNESSCQNNSATIEMLIFTIGEKKVLNYRKLPQKELYILLIREKQKNNKEINEWVLPNDYIQLHLHENLDSIALRILREKTNLSEAYIEQLYTFREEDEITESSNINIAYMALVPQNDRIEFLKNDDTYESKWFRIDYDLESQKESKDNRGNLLIIQNYDLKLQRIDEVLGTVNVKLSINNKIVNQTLIRELIISESSGIAKKHGKIINCGLERLKNKIEYTDIIFQLMPKTFTFSELQQVYELLLGSKLYTAQFRRKIEPKLIRLTDIISEGKGHRPAQYYCFNPIWALKNE